MRILICGDRNWKSHTVIEDVLDNYGEPTSDTVIHGAAKGADLIGAATASSLGFEVEAYPADWERYGKGAGPIRNQQMLNSDIDLVLAFHDDIKQSKGTKDMLQRAKAKSVECHLFNSKGEEYATD